MTRALFNSILALAVLTLLPNSLAAQEPSPATAEQQTKRIILKDGSYQMVLKYEMQGDRVHYLSAERYEWEDLPASLVDWDATKKYEADLSKGKARAHVETPEEREEREREEANSPEIEPGLRLPGTGGVLRPASSRVGHARGRTDHPVRARRSAGSLRGRERL